ncbi:uncharacterized protein BDZ99DRAFT_515674 [Mytilinidion resinicola]|uniref:Uncharacterized protein n=1 Tax=Mytilinidion resinicola TaxID=574789 RepID=A0A6A6Z1C5_9PEZI|nr:uncharacterized protein BDZ99DRAFT_515674 [Mytilinidion resinicola]KAF2814911.1 hypothetical protein BDZ99DRAFT_515674 [Mytilinidion resinicola]
MRVSAIITLCSAFIAGVSAAPVAEKRGNIYGAVLYRDLNFGGDAEYMWVDDDSCVQVSDGMQDKASSLKIYAGQTCNLYNAYSYGEGEGWIVFEGPTD